MTTTANSIPDPSEPSSTTKTENSLPSDQTSAKWVKERLGEAKQFAQTLPWEQIKDGSWFSRLLTASLGAYAREVNADFFRRKYPGVPTDVIVERQIELAQKYAAISGGMTAGAYSAAVVSSFGTAGLTVPVAVMSFITDVFVTTQIQLRLAYDMAVLYGVPVNLNDPEDLFDLIRVAFGVKAGEVFQQAIGKLSPEATKQAVKSVFKGATLEAMRALPVVGRYLLQKNLVKFAIPVVGVAISAGMNWFTTRGIGKIARETYRERAVIREAALGVADFVDLEPLVFMRVMRLMVEADGKRQASEAHFLADLVRHVVSDGEPPTWIAQLEGEIVLNRTQLMADVAKLPEDVRARLFDAAVLTATIDREVQAKELEVLRDLASVCGVSFDASAIRAAAQHRIT